jgi:hypothetical protein
MMGMRNLIFYLWIVAGFCSCNDRYLSKEDLKVNFERPERPAIEQKPLVQGRSDSSLFLTSPPDTLVFKDLKGINQKMKLTGDQLVRVLYTRKNGFWERGLHTTLRHNQIYIHNDTLFSTVPIRSGMFRREKKPFIPLSDISDIKIKNISWGDDRFSILTLPQSLVDVYGGTSYRLGLEFKIYRNLSAYLEGGRYFSYFPSGPESALRGSIFLPEIKYYLNGEGFTTGRYLALQYAYKDQTTNLSDTVTIQQPAGPVRVLKNYELNAIIQSINLKYGDLVIRKKCLVIDYYAGIGVDFRNANSTLTSAEQNSIMRRGDYSLTETRYQTGNLVYPNITFGIRIGYRISK